jgi:hypothetical protein
VNSTFSPGRSARADLGAGHATGKNHVAEQQVDLRCAFQQPPRCLVRRDFGVCDRIGRVDVRVHGLYRETTTFRHGIAHVDRQVEDRGLERVRVDFDAPKARAAHGLDRDRLAEGAIQQIRHAADECIRIERLAAREREQLLGKGGGLSRAVHYSRLDAPPNRSRAS